MERVLVAAGKTRGEFEREVEKLKNEILSFMTKSYAQNVYIYGKRKFESSVPLE